jgi:tetratricopeptide (TPR) repeat protein
VTFGDEANLNSNDVQSQRPKLDHLILEAQQAALNGQLARAKRLFCRVLEHNPASAIARRGYAEVTAQFARRKTRSLLRDARAAFKDNRNADAKVLFAEARALDPRSVPAARGYARCLSNNNEWAAAAEAWRYLIELDPKEPVPYHRLFTALRELGDLDRLRAALSSIPDRLCADPHFALRAIVPGYLQLGLHHQARVVCETFPKEEFSPDEWAAYSRVLYQSGKYRELADNHRAFGVDVTANAEYAFHVLYVLYKLGEQTTFQREFGKFFEASPEASVAETQLACFCRLPPAAIDESTKVRLIRTAIESRWIFEKSRNFHSIVDKIPTSMASEIEATIAELPDISFQIIFRASLLRAQQTQQLDASALGSLSWTDIETESNQVYDKVRRAALSSDKPLMQLPTVVAMNASSKDLPTALNSESLADAAKLAQWIRSRIDRSRPTSIVRVGDGEGTFLPYEDEIKNYEARDRKYIQQIWWRPENMLVSPLAEQQLSRHLQDTLLNADAIGLPNTERIAKDHLLHGTFDTQRARGLRAALYNFLNIARDKYCCELLFSCNAHLDLLNWNLYGEVLVGLHEVSYVSCHDLSPVLLENFGLKTKWCFRTPPENQFAEAMSAENRGISPLFPNGLNAFIESAPVEPGDVYLIGAGIVGKLMCDHVKRRGGIALDVGSIADYWAGHNTRGSLVWDLDFSLAASLIRNRPFADAPALEFSPAPHKTDKLHRRNVLAEFTDLKDGSGGQQNRTATYALRMIGHPRCGSGYVAQAFQARKIDIEHNRLSTDGVCSWMAAVKDFSVPHGDPTADCRFGETGAFLRHPKDALPSIVLENGKSSSFLFRRYHIWNQFGVDLALLDDPIERAVASLVHWMDIVASCRPDFRVRVEHFSDDFTNAIELGKTRLMPSAMDPDETLSALYNSSEQRYLVAKPSYTADDYARVRPELRCKLEQLCETWGYDPAFLG